MAPPCVYSEGSYWVTADICSGDGGGGVGSERCGEEKRGGGQEEGGAGWGEGKGRASASACLEGDSLPE